VSTWQIGRLKHSVDVADREAQTQCRRGDQVKLWSARCCEECAGEADWPLAGSHLRRSAGIWQDTLGPLGRGCVGGGLVFSRGGSAREVRAACPAPWRGPAATAPPMRPLYCRGWVLRQSALVLDTLRWPETDLFILAPRDVIEGGLRGCENTSH
jgi:hypothetical protein